MARITKIESVKAPTMKKRVAAYARVSTDGEDQLLSLENQREHYENWIKSNPEWEYVDTYYDEGISGTKVDRRQGLLQLIDDCEHGRIDFVITKSISRFARNNADCLELTRKLLGLGIPIYFEKENIDTSKMESELLLSIMGSIAEAESTSIAENSKWSIRLRFQNGTFKVSYPPYGYYWDKEKAELFINEEEAEVVRFIFDEVIAGKGTETIADELQKKGVPTKRNAKWSSGAVNAILKNEKYTGDCLFQKTYTDSSFVRHDNKGEVDQFYVENHHEPIVSKEVYEAAHRVIAQHRAEKNIGGGTGKYQMRYPLSGKLICGDCGAHMRRRIRSDNKEVIYSCPQHIKDLTSCSMKSIWNYKLEMAFVRMMNKLIFSRNKLLKLFCIMLESNEKKKSPDEVMEINMMLEELSERKVTLKQLLAQGLIEPGMYKQEFNEAVIEIERLMKKKDSVRHKKDSGTEHLMSAKELLAYTEKAEMLKEFDGEVFERFCDHIVVKNQEEIEFHLKCGLNLTERM